VGHVEYQGTLETIEANRKLARENPKAWIESQNNKIEALLDGNAAKSLLHLGTLTIIGGKQFRCQSCYRKGCLRL
jgi:hypothetical protein